MRKLYKSITDMLCVSLLCPFIWYIEGRVIINKIYYNTKENTGWINGGIGHERN